MPRLTHLTVTDLLDALASNAPLPAGGSAAALAAAAGVSLLIKVATLPVRRLEQDAQVARSGAEARLRPVRDVLVALVDRDPEAYAHVLAAYRLPRTTDEESSVRQTAVASAMQAATEPPLEMLRGCHDALRCAALVAEHAPAAALADVDVAVELLRAGVRSAGAAIDSNVDAPGMEDFAGPIRAERATLESASLEEVARARAVIARRRATI